MLIGLSIPLLGVFLLSGAMSPSEHDDTAAENYCQRGEPNLQSDAGTKECHAGEGSASHLDDCPDIPPNLGEFTVDMRVLSLSAIEKGLMTSAGGRWRPPHCRSRDKVAILVPYRDRWLDLLIFLNNIHRFLQAQLVEYGIFVIEQADRKNFNRGALLNIGFVEALRLGDYACVVLHDVDKFPEDTRNLYRCQDNPTHLATMMKYPEKRARYRSVPYEEYFGGVTAIRSDQFRLINGFSNIYWGWGSEDDDLMDRMLYRKLKISRVSEEVGRYLEIWHPYGFVNKDRHDLREFGYRRYKKDGLNSLNYALNSITMETTLYTNISVTLLHEDPFS